MRCIIVYKNIRKKRMKIFACEHIFLNKGDKIIMDSYLIVDYYFILDGIVQVKKIYNKKISTTLVFLGKNDSFGFKRQNKFYYVAKALNPTNLLVRNFSFSELKNKLKIENIVEIFAHREISKRVIVFILILCKQFGRNISSGILIDLELSHADIASIIGSTRSTITRILKKLKEKNLINSYSKRIIVFNPIFLSYLLI
uniref:Global nitrogen transcriptional regulator n=1 Tax=Flintiella sanguinaria TaxID=101926 RepID=A0A1X9PW20_9RHOD|nr:global nitrogen transcriptional regulator [Flintiella sanguinaria]